MGPGFCWSFSSPDFSHYPVLSPGPVPSISFSSLSHLSFRASPNPGARLLSINDHFSFTLMMITHGGCLISLAFTSCLMTEIVASIFDVFLSLFSVDFRSCREATSPLACPGGEASNGAVGDLSCTAANVERRIPRSSSFSSLRQRTGESESKTGNV